MNDGRNLQFVVATNLAYITDEILDFAKVHLYTSRPRSTVRETFTTEIGRVRVATVTSKR